MERTKLFLQKLPFHSFLLKCSSQPTLYDSVPYPAFLCSYKVSINADGQHIYEYIYILKLYREIFLVFRWLCLLPGVMVFASAEFFHPMVDVSGSWSPSSCQELLVTKSPRAGHHHLLQKQMRDKFQRAAVANLAISDRSWQLCLAAS